MEYLHIFLAIIVLLLNICDAFSSIHCIEYGAIELNPLMNILFNCGVYYFIIFKHMLCSIGIFNICMSRQKKYINYSLILLFIFYFFVVINNMYYFFTL